ncbi:hypothetical protein B296_00007094 [Ensete ventricosum]|uniref:Uncharacterized protein n=1 Tax=Ensete ventricosum TaxID=4639 RepID=A0A426YXX2_ENSVE|nr:hypothetical protein B296_00007094 [Ensete ventricosum]
MLLLGCVSQDSLAQRLPQGLARRPSPGGVRSMWPLRRSSQCPTEMVSSVQSLELVGTKNPLELVGIESLQELVGTKNLLELVEHYCLGSGLVEHYYPGSGLAEHYCSSFGLAKHCCWNLSLKNIGTGGSAVNLGSLPTVSHPKTWAAMVQSSLTGGLLVEISGKVVPSTF